MATLNFNAQQVSPESEFSPLPAGIYIAQITDSEIKPTKTGSGHYLQLTWKVLDGQHAGRLVFDRLNIANENERAQKIGQQQLSQLCHAVGVLQLQDSQQLHQRPCRIKLVVKNDPQYGDSNEVKGYEAAAPGAGMTPPAAPAFAPPPVANKPATPWGQRAA